MRYQVEFAYWYEGEYETKYAEHKKECEETGKELDYDYIFNARHHRDFMFEAESKKEAVAEGLKRYNIDMDHVRGDLSHFMATAIPYLTLGELIDKAPVLSSVRNISRVIEYFPDVDPFYFDDEKAEAEAGEQIRIDYYVDEYIDGSRSMEMGCVFWCDLPVLVFQQAGRGPGDHDKHWVIDRDRKHAMSSWLMRFHTDEFLEEETPLDKEMTEISFFYGTEVANLPLKK